MQNPKTDPGLDTQPYRLMRQSLSRWADFREAEWLMLERIFQPRLVAKSEYLLRPGETAKRILFVVSGLLRYFYREPGGDEANKIFLTEGMFSSPLSACTLEPELGCGVQALEDSLVLYADADAFNALYDAHPIFDRLGRKLGEWWLGRKELRTRTFQRQDGRERYLGFISHHGDLAQRVPQYHIASYLGITEVSLSRIRRGLARPLRSREPTSASAASAG